MSGRLKACGVLPGPKVRACDLAGGPVSEARETAAKRPVVRVLPGNLPVGELGAATREGGGLVEVHDPAVAVPAGLDVECVLLARHAAADNVVQSDEERVEVRQQD